MVDRWWHQRSGLFRVPFVEDLSNNQVYENLVEAAGPLIGVQPEANDESEDDWRERRRRLVKRPLRMVQPEANDESESDESEDDWRERRHRLVKQRLRM